MPVGIDAAAGAGPGGGARQARHVPEVRAQETMVCPGKINYR